MGVPDLAISCREKWLFRPAAQPHLQAGLQEVAKPSLLEPEPFAWRPQQRSGFEFEMLDGVIRVFRGPGREQEAFPVPGNSFDFFSDMHWFAL